MTIAIWKHLAASILSGRTELIRRLRWFVSTPAERRHSMVGAAKLWKMKREFQINFLRQVGLEPQHYLLDIGCGTLRGGIPIIEYLEVGHYFGIESRRQVLDEGRRELQEFGLSHKQPQLIAADNILTIKLDKMMDYIWAFSVLLHMKDKILYDTLRFVSLNLADTGFFFANVNIGKKLDGKWQGFPIVWGSLSFYEKACADNGLKINDIGSLKGFGHISGVELQDQQRMLKIWKEGKRSQG